jgi:hypothetical protein
MLIFQPTLKVAAWCLFQGADVDLLLGRSVEGQGELFFLGILCSSGINMCKEGGA